MLKKLFINYEGEVMSTKDLLAKRLKLNTQKHLDHQKEHFEYKKELRRNIVISDINVSPYQPRKVFDEIELQNLADSIAEIGLLQPISVRNIMGKYELIAGERRLKAHQILKKETIEAIIIDVPDDDIALLALAENLKREDLSDYEIYIGLNNLNDHLKKNKTKLAKSLGMNREDMYKYLSYEKLPKEILIDLNVAPHLLGRTAATQVKKYLNDHTYSKISIDALIYVWEKLKNKKLEQMKLVFAANQYIDKKENPLLEQSKQITGVQYKGRMVGKIHFDQRKLKVVLDTNEISDLNMEKLQNILQDILTDADKV